MISIIDYFAIILRHCDNVMLRCLFIIVITWPLNASAQNIPQGMEILFIKSFGTLDSSGVFFNLVLHDKDYTGKPWTKLITGRFFTIPPADLALKQKYEVKSYEVAESEFENFWSDAVENHLMRMKDSYEPRDNIISWKSRTYLTIRSITETDVVNKTILISRLGDPLIQGDKDPVIEDLSSTFGFFDRWVKIRGKDLDKVELQKILIDLYIRHDNSWAQSYIISALMVSGYDTSFALDSKYSDVQKEYLTMRTGSSACTEQRNIRMRLDDPSPEVVLFAVNMLIRCVSGKDMKKEVLFLFEKIARRYQYDPGVVYMIDDFGRPVFVRSETEKGGLAPKILGNAKNELERIIIKLKAEIESDGRSQENKSGSSNNDAKH